ncbi:hypothetical protein Tco_0634037 [Tanacetum coccineum]
MKEQAYNKEQRERPRPHELNDESNLIDLMKEYQAKPIEKHLKEVKRIFLYLRETVNIGLWYTKDSGFELTEFSDANYTGCKDTLKSTSAGRPLHQSSSSGSIQLFGSLPWYNIYTVKWSSRNRRLTNWKTAKYSKIWYDEDVHDLISVETEFPAIVFNDNLTSNETLSCEPMVSSLNDNEIDFRISFDESDDEDYTPMVSYFDDLDYFKDFEKEFPAIVYNDAQTSKLDFLTEPTLSPQHIDEFDLKSETSFSECDEEEENVLYFNDLFRFNVIYPDDSKSDKDNDDDEIDIKQSSGGNVINTDDGDYAHGSNKLLETSYDTSNKIFKTETFIKELKVKMDDPNITMEEYIMLEEEKARRRGKLFNWETAKYSKIWYDEDVHDLRSVETEFPAIVFNDNLTSNETLSCEPTVSSLNDNEIDFRISFDESDDEDYTVFFDKNSFSYKIISVNDLKTNSENDNDKVNMPFLPSPEPTVNYFDDLDYFKDFEKEFPAIVYNDAQTSKLDFLTEPTLSPQHIDEFDLKSETSLSECDEEEENVLYFNDLFRFNVIYPDDSKSDKDNDDDEIDIKQSSGGINTAYPGEWICRIDFLYSFR